MQFTSINSAIYIKLFQDKMTEFIKKIMDTKLNILNSENMKNDKFNIK